VYLVQKKCSDVQSLLNQLSVNPVYEKVQYYYLESLNQTICVHDPVKAAEYEKLFEQAGQKKETPLEKL
jgi:hypothetical protein